MWYVLLLRNPVKGLSAVDLAVVTISDLQQISVGPVLCSRIADTTDSLSACCSTFSLLNIFCMLMQTRWRVCTIARTFSDHCGLLFGGLNTVYI